MRLTIPLLCVLATPGLAQDNPSGIAFTFGLGAESRPDYFGADTAATGVTAAFALDRLRWGPFSVGNGPDRDGLGMTGSFRYIGARTSADFDELSSLADIDPALELGGGLKYTTPGAEAFMVVRRGFGGHDGFVGEIGGDVIVTPADRITLRAGPRVFAGDDSFAATYFGQTAAEGVTLTDPFEATGGILSRGIEISAEYALGNDWGVTGTVRYDQLLNDAANSPITANTDQVSASVVVTRDFSFGF